MNREPRTKGDKMTHIKHIGRGRGSNPNSKANLNRVWVVTDNNKYPMFGPYSKKTAIKNADKLTTIGNPYYIAPWDDLAIADKVALITA